MHAWHTSATRSADRCVHWSHIIFRSARCASIIGISATTENTATQLFEFVLPTARKADEVVGLIHQLSYFQLQGIGRQQEAYNAIPWLMIYSRRALADTISGEVSLWSRYSENSGTDRQIPEASTSGRIVRINEFINTRRCLSQVAGGSKEDIRQSIHRIQTGFSSQFISTKDR